jgi:hypothetical protein
MKFFKRPMFAVTAATMAVAMVWGQQTTFAQGAQPTAPSSGFAVYNACTATDYAGTAATALGITPAELRKDVVSGQSLQDIATSKNVDLQIVTTALQTASKADIDQAVKDGILTQDEATALESGNFGRAGGLPGQGNQPSGQAPQGSQGNAQQLPQGGLAPQNGQNGPRGGQFDGQQGNALPDINNLRFLLQTAPSNAPATPDASGQPQGNRGFGRQGFGLRGANFNVVRPYVVAAQALNLKCADLVKTLVTTQGKTIAAVAADQKVDTATVTAALTKAYKDALAQDVTDGIITQAQSDQASTNLDKAVTNFVSNASMRGPRPPQGQ